MFYRCLVIRIRPIRIVFPLQVGIPNVIRRAWCQGPEYIVTGRSSAGLRQGKFI